MLLPIEHILMFLQSNNIKIHLKSNNIKLTCNTRKNHPRTLKFCMESLFLLALMIQMGAQNSEDMT